MLTAGIEDGGGAVAGVDNGGSGFDPPCRGDLRRPIALQSYLPRVSAWLVAGLEGRIGAAAELGVAGRRAARAAGGDDGWYLLMQTEKSASARIALLLSARSISGYRIYPQRSNG